MTKENGNEIESREEVEELLGRERDLSGQDLSGLDL
jgi:hypothetical protein